VIARRSSDQLGSLLAAGLSLWIFIEAFINMAVIVGLVPFAGNALPFISAGGSNLTASLAAVGIITSIARQSSERSQQEERSFSAVVNMRGRDGGRSIPRTRRTPVTRDRS
ncbi:MAG TPA: FtsW/RodA/SpoVE family cell cycle protein, partial [Anaerolineaceae bacterium]